MTLFKNLRVLFDGGDERICGDRFSNVMVLHRNDDRLEEDEDDAFR